MEPKWKVINFLQTKRFCTCYFQSHVPETGTGKVPGGIELRRSVERYAKESKIQNYNSKRMSRHTRALKKFFET